MVKISQSQFSFIQFSFLKIFIEIYLIYNVLISDVQQSDSVKHIYVCIYIFFFRFFSIIGYYKILSIVPIFIQFRFDQCRATK